MPLRAATGRLKRSRVDPFVPADSDSTDTTRFQDQEQLKEIATALFDLWPESAGKQVDVAAIELLRAAKVLHAASTRAQAVTEEKTDELEQLRFENRELREQLKLERQLRSSSYDLDEHRQRLRTAQQVGQNVAKGVKTFAKQLDEMSPGDDDSLPRFEGGSPSDGASKA